jgi:hypothetical protein
VDSHPTLEREMACVEAADHRTLAAELGRIARIDFLLIDKALQFGHEFVRLEGGGKEFQHTQPVFDLYRFPGFCPGVKAVLISLIFPLNSRGLGSNSVPGIYTSSTALPFTWRPAAVR